MINCTDLQGRLLFVNPDLMERIELTPDTQIVFVNGRRLYVSEEPEKLVERIVEYRQRVGIGAGAVPVGPGGDQTCVREG